MPGYPGSTPGHPGLGRLVDARLYVAGGSRHLALLITTSAFWSCKPVQPSLEGFPASPGFLTPVCQVITGSNLPEAQLRCCFQDSVEGPCPPVLEGWPICFYP